MTERTQSNWLESYLELTKRAESPKLYREWAGIWTLCAVLENRVYVEWDKLTYPNLYVLLVGETSVRKGAALGPPTKFLEALEMNIAPQSCTWQALFDVHKEGARPILDMPPNYPYENISPCHVIAGEFSMLVGRKSDSDEFFKFVTDVYDYQTRFYKQYTRSCGKFTIEGAFLHILGAIQPAVIPQIIPQWVISSGFPARVIYVFAREKDHREEDPTPTQEERELFQELLLDLVLMRELQGQFIVTDECRKLIGDWYAEFDENPPPELDEQALHGYRDRRVSTLLKISMGLKVSKSDELVLDAETFYEGVEALDRVEKPMRLVYSSYGTLPIAQFSRPLFDLIENRKPEWVSFGELMGKLYKDLTTDDLNHLLLGLEAKKWIRKEVKGNAVVFQAISDAFS